MKRDLNKKSAKWYEDTAWSICHEAHMQRNRIVEGYRSYELALRPYQQKKLKQAIETRYKTNKAFSLR